MARILVTGGAGFIGSNLAHALVARGDDVVIIDDFSTGRRENLAGIWDKIRVVNGCLTDQTAVKDALDGVTGVLHQGALPSVPKSLDIPIETNHANVVGTLTLLEMCRQTGVDRLVYAASSSAYGDHQAAVKSESLEPRPKSPYAVQKLTGEYYCSVYRDLFGIKTIALRYFNIFGPRQNPKSQYAAVVPAFVTRMLRGERPIIYGDGGQSRDFTYIDNAISANLAALEAPEGACGLSYNVACGQSVTLLQLVQGINDILGTQIEPEFAPERAGDVRHSRADVGRAKAAFGYEPLIDVKQGLQRSVEWYRQNS